MTELDLSIQARNQVAEFDDHLQIDRYKNPVHPLLYQYRNFASFWTIVKGDSFWATNARFSNDTEEQRFGANLIKRLLNNAIDPTELLNENYIVCFCTKDDQLSQWRGYAPDGGVSIGFDFDAAAIFYTPVKEKSLADKLIPNHYKICFVESGQVCYLPSFQMPEKAKYEEREVEYKQYLETCRNAIALTAGSPDNHSKPEFLQELVTKAPFIKHKGFQEESEWRLIFRNEENVLDQCVRYRETPNAQVNFPYIVVRPGSPEFDAKNCTIRLCLKEKQDILSAITDLKTVPGIGRVDSCRVNSSLKKDLTDDFCFGCTRRHWQDLNNICEPCRYAQQGNYAFALHNAENSIIISQGQKQEEIFHVVHKWARMYLKNLEVKVWCEGHLPIRTITIGPCQNQMEAAESIRHYCSHIYWLNDVDIKLSDIPFRKTL